MSWRRGRHGSAIGLTGAEVHRRVKAHDIFDDVSYGFDGGQPGVFFWVCQGNYHAFLKRRSSPSPDEDLAYGATPGEPTRLVRMDISKEKQDKRYTNPPMEPLGSWSPEVGPGYSKHRFEKQAKGDPKLEKFLEDILRVFNAAKCPLSKRA
jgi:hypothetical protein